MKRLDIDSQNWVQLNSLFDSALDMPKDEREAWVTALGSEHDSLKPQLRRLLARAAVIENKEVLRTLPSIGAPRVPDALPDRSGEIIGPYRVVRQLGSGGMASVWLAERTDGLVNRPVALKLPHATGQRGLGERMARERDMLATLTHPNIARLYDAGVTTDGQPYLALEYIEGQRIDDYCREHVLDVRARLKLFLQIGRAVAYAHAKLIVHRDLKPANILISNDAQARLLDFGVGKLLDGNLNLSSLTELSGRAFTPDYASPEQILGESLTISSDVYSLGVVLYELLSGVRPYKLMRNSRGALEDAIIATQPAKPSDVAEPATRSALRGDLDTITLTALRKEPAQRYATVNALAEDIERYLDRRPILAQPDSLWYRTQKFVLRNRVTVIAASIAVIGVLSFAGVAVWQARTARSEQQRAEQVKEFVAAIFRDADPYQGQLTKPSANDLLRQALEKIDRIDHQDRAVRVELLNVVGESLIALGSTDDAEKVARQSVQEAAQGLSNDALQSVRAHLLLTDVLRNRGRLDEMRVELTQLLPLVVRRATKYPADLIRVYENQAHLDIDAGEAAQAVVAAQHGFDLAKATFGDTHPTTVALSNVLAESSQYDTMPRNVALEVAERALRFAQHAYPNTPNHPHLIAAHEVYGRSLTALGRDREAIVELNLSLQAASEVFGASSLQVAFKLTNMVPTLRRLGELNTVLDYATRALAVHAQHVQSDSFTYASTLAGRGTTYWTVRRGNEALQDLTQAIESFTASIGPDAVHTWSARGNRAVALAYVGKQTEAEAELMPVLAWFQTHNTNQLLGVLHLMGVVHRVDGNYSQAREDQEHAIKLNSAGPGGDTNRLRFLAELGLNELELHHTDQAFAALTTSLQLAEKLQTTITPQRADVLVGLGRIELTRGHPREALALLTQADTFWRNFDADNRWAGEASLWLGRCYLALGRSAEANKALTHAEKILSHSPLRIDIPLAAFARQRK